MIDTTVGEQLEGRYELVELISEGGMGAVYRARHRQLDREVAVKFMNASTREDPEMLERFTREARVASSLNHPNIVSVTDFGIDEERGYFIVMELLTGQSLRARMGEQNLKPRVACDIIEQVAWALRYIHARGVMHCDLKPENVFLAQLDDESRRRNHVKLIDFGLAFHRNKENGYSLAGTPPYLAPERLRGAPPSPAADLYALGALFYELVTGQPPFDGPFIHVAEQQLRGELPPAPSTLIDGEPLEGRTDDVIMRLLSYDPEMRPRNAEAFLFELRTLMSMMGMRVRRVARAAMQRRTPPTGSPGTVKRMHERVPLNVPCKVRRRGAKSAIGCTENLSEGGAFVTLPESLPLGEEVYLDLPLTEQSQMSVRAVVRWRRSSGLPGCGLEFLDLSDSMRVRLFEATT